MLYQPTNIYPSMTGSLGNGVVDAARELRVTWQVNGNSAMVAYQIAIYRNNADSTQLYSTGKQTQGCPFYGVDAAGNVQFFSHTITAAALSGAGIANGGEYKLVIRQWWGSSDAQSVTQTSASAFITRNAPGLTIGAISDPLAVREYTFTALYTQAQGDSLNWVRWQFALVDTAGDYETLRDTGKIYGTGELKFTYDGMFSGSRYAVRCSVQTQSGVEADTGWQAFGVSYTTEPIPGALTACATRQGVRLTFPAVKSLPAEITGAYEVDDSYLKLPAGSKAVWDTEDGEAMALSGNCDIVWRGKADAEGAVLKVAGDGLTAQFTMGKTPFDPSGGGQQWNCAFGAGVYVIAGPQGKFFWSADGKVWTAVNAGAGTALEWRCVCYGGGKFAAFSTRVNGSVYATYSTDGKTWATPSTVKTSADITSVCYGNGMYLAAGKMDVLRCTDRVNMLWERVESPNTLGVNYDITIAFDGSKFLVPLHYLYLTTNGLVWSELREVEASHACFGGGIYLVWGGFTLYRSTDLLTWTQRRFKAWSSFTFEEIAYGDGVFLSCVDLNDQYTDGCSVLYSRDGETWSAAQIPATSAADKYEWYNACYGDSGFLIVNSSSPVAVVTIQEGTVEFEADVVTTTTPVSQPEFEAGQLPVDFRYRSICYGNGKIVAVPNAYSSNIFQVSSDNGVTWTGVALSVSKYWCSVAYSSTVGRYVAIATDGTSVYSSDAATWTQSSTGLAAIARRDWKKLIWADGFGKFLAIGPYTRTSVDGVYVYTNKIAYSSDGINWNTSEITHSSFLNDIAYGGGTAVILGDVDSGKTLRSTDGINWVDGGTTGHSTGFASICYGGNVFVSCVLAGFYYSSNGGVSWTGPVNGGISGDFYSRSMAYLEGIGFLAVNDSQSADNAGNAVLFNLPADIRVIDRSFYGFGVTAADGVLVVCGIRNNSISNVMRVMLEDNGGTVSPVARYQTFVPTLHWQDICYGNGKFVAICDVLTFQVSTDGISWTSKGGFATMPKLSICYGSRGFACIGSTNGSFVMQSADGEKWFQEVGGHLKQDGVSRWGSITYGNGMYVAFGTTTSGGGIAARSTDLKSWSYSQAGLSTNGSTFGNGKIVYQGGVFVALYQDYAIHRSTDGVSWTRYDLSSFLGSPALSLNAAGGKFIITPRNNSPLVLSEDGITWRRSDSVAVTILFSVSYGMGFYVAVGASRSFMWSKDASTWYRGTTPEAPNTDGNTFWSGISFGNGRFVAVGASNTSAYADTMQMTRELKFQLGGAEFARAAIRNGGDMTLLLGGESIQWDNHEQTYVMRGIAACYPGFDNIRSLELDGKQECDYLMVSDGKMSDAIRKKLLSDMTYHPVNQDAQFYADFNGSTNGGGVAGTQFTAFSIYRLEDGRSVLRHIANVTPEDGSVIVDASAVNDRRYTYYAFGVGADTFVTSALISNAVTLCGWDWTLLSCTADGSGVYHVEELFLFGKNLVSGGVTNNNTPQVLQSFTRYPAVQPAPQNYRSGTLQSLIGTITDCRYSDTREVRDAIWALSTTANTLFLKNRKGDLLRIRTAGAIEMDTGDNSPLQPQTVSLPWVEIGSAEDAQIVVTRRDGAWGG